MKPILEIQNISKRFKINNEQQSYLNIRDSITNLFKSKEKMEVFWALNDISFDVLPGDTVGIIGKNGAGKSTLLKILSKITPPTSGKIIGRGRIASLLEVGTGFHSELSGRENVFMNGSILGMKRSEILRNFDAIIDFAGIEKFIDTPLKHYSSGMQLRLAFAVAAFLENEILIIDEVLAVGDLAFQKKCMDKMGDVSKSGRTILFVSHNMGAVSQLCKKGIFLHNGRVNSIGSISDVTDSYLGLENNTDNNSFSREYKCFDKLMFFEIETFNEKNLPANSFGFNEFVKLKLKIFIPKDFDQTAKLSVTLLDKYQARIFTTVSLLKDFIENESELLCVTIQLPKSIIAPNLYAFRYALFNDNGKVFDLQENITKIKIIDTGTDMNKYEGIDYGSVILKCDWANEKLN